MSDADMQTITSQLGKAPRGVIAVARRCRFGSPQVVVSNPVVFGPGRRSERKAGVGKKDLRVFPTTYWLTCPQLATAVGQLEGAGWVGRLSHWLAEADLSAQMAAAHQRAAAERVALVDPGLGEQLQAEQPKQWQVLVQVGIGGARAHMGVKCLHSHLADYLAGPAGWDRLGTAPTGARNPIGAHVLALLLQNGHDVKGWPGCHGCDDAHVTLTETSTKSDTEPLIAALDVGTNSCRSLCCRIENKQPVPVSFSLKTTRLGEGLQETGRLTPDAIQRTVAGLSQLLEAMRVDKAMAHQELQVVAAGTNAVRSAQNGADFLVKAWEDLGLAVRVLQGEEEAQLSFRGALAGLTQQDEAESDRDGLHEPVLVLDIGGGSTELVSGDWQGTVNWSGSADIGAVRLFEMYKRGDCQMPTSVQPYSWETAGLEELTTLAHTAEHYLRQQFSQQLNGVPVKATLVGVGGTCTSVAAMDLQLQEYQPGVVQGHRISVERIARLGAQVARMSLAERQNITGLQPQRGDIILAGIALILAVMRITSKTELLVSNADILLGLIRQFNNACISSENRV